MVKIARLCPRGRWTLLLRPHGGLNPESVLGRAWWHMVLRPQNLHSVHADSELAVSPSLLTPVPAAAQDYQTPTFEARKGRPSGKVKGSCDSVEGLWGVDMWVFASSLVAYEEDSTEGSGREHGVWGMSLRGAGGAEARCPPPGRQNRVSVLPPGPAWSDTLLVLCLPPPWGLFGVMTKRPCRCFGSGHPAQPENKAHMILSSRFYFQAE